MHVNSMRLAAKYRLLLNESIN